MIPELECRMDHEHIDSLEDLNRAVIVEKTKSEILRLGELFDVWGHGVETEETARDIVLDGYVTGWTTINDFAYKFPSYPEGIQRYIDGWDYHGRDFKVLFAIPKGMWASDTDRELAKTETQRYIYDDVQDGDKLRRFGEHAISPQKIVGYINDKGKLIRNEHFDSNILNLEYQNKGKVVQKDED